MDEEMKTPVTDDAEGVPSSEDVQKEEPSVDEKIKAAVESAKAEWEKGLDERIEKERSDAAARAKMTAEQRAKADAEAEQKKFEEEREQYRREKLEFDVTRSLASKKINTAFAPYISAMGADGMEENIKGLEALLSDYRQTIVDELTRGKPPKDGGKDNSKTDPFLSGFGS